MFRLFPKKKDIKREPEPAPGVMRLRLVPSKMREYDGTVTSRMALDWVKHSLWRTGINTLPMTIFSTMPFYIIWALCAASISIYENGSSSIFHAPFLVSLLHGLFFYLYILFMVTLETMLFSQIPSRYPQAINIMPDGFSIGNRKRVIPWTSVKFAGTHEVVYRTMRKTTVLELYLPKDALKGNYSPFERFKDWFTLRQFSLETTFFDPQAKKLRANPYEGTCLRVPLDLLAFESDRTNLIKAIQANVSNSNIAPEVLNGVSSAAGETFTTLWLDDLRAGANAGGERSLETGHSLQGNRYAITGILGHGGFSVVYSATEGEEAVAIKELMIGSGGTRASKEAILKNIAAEIEILKKLDHPNIVKCRDYFIEGGRIYIVMQALQGANLRDHIEHNGRLDSATIEQVAQQCCTILKYLHEDPRRIIHRDFTPDNLIWDGERVMLIDFNVAEDLNAATSPTIVGKQCYLAPEQWSGIFTETGDFYQLGCTLFFLGAGHDPEPLSQSNLSLVRDDVPSHLCRLIAALTASKEADRPGKAENVAEWLAART